MSATPDAVLLDATRPVWRVTLNRPRQGNACSAELVSALDAVLARVEAQAPQALMLLGEGRHFCTGFDLSDLERETDDTLLARFVRIELMLQRLARAGCLTIGLAHGRTVGAGADLFAACTLRLARPGTSFAFPGARGFGLVLGTRRLACRVGSDTALAWVETGGVIAADEAVASGLVNEIVTDLADADRLVAARAHEDSWLRRGLRSAVDPHASADDARDLDLLVRSAARPGLQQRVAAYLDRVASARRAGNPPAAA